MLTWWPPLMMGDGMLWMLPRAIKVCGSSEDVFDGTANIFHGAKFQREGLVCSPTLLYVY